MLNSKDFQKKKGGSPALKKTMKKIKEGRVRLTPAVEANISIKIVSKSRVRAL